MPHSAKILRMEDHSGEFCKRGHRIAEVGRASNRGCRACIREAMRGYRAEGKFRYDPAKHDPRAALDKWLRRSYGLTLDEYEAMHDLQAGVCAICREPETIVRNGRVQRLSVDHDHVTNENRGLLCHNCNRAVGLLGDNVQRAFALAEYLRRYSDAGKGLQEVG